MIVIATQCFPPATGGVETLMAGLADAISASGRGVAVFADGADDGSDAARGYRVVRATGWKPLRRRRKAWAVGAAARAGATLVICDSWKSLELLPDVGAAKIHCLAHGMELPPDPSARKTARIKRAFARATKVIANSRFSAGLCAPFMPLGVAAAAATPPIPPQPEATDAARAALARTLGDAEPVIAFLGRLEPRKGVDRVIQALAALGARYPNAVFAVGGAGGDLPRLEALAEAEGVARRVKFLGRVDEPAKAALLERADVFAMPARRDGASVEGFGIVYLEAAWRGAPALAGREGGAADAVLDGRTGLLCDGADAASVAAGLDALLSDPVERERMRFLAAAHARDQLWSARVGDYL